MLGAVRGVDTFLSNHELVQQLDVRRSPISLLKYDVGGRYTSHRDAGPAHPRRLLTLLTYLNDDFEGGGTRFTAEGREVLPVAGMGVLFDAGLAHSGEAVSKGRKYAMVTWLRRPA
jgi:Rps23 Pro-64 3,4-dihydroxylase Tpa1-like proline 4-hydroxylase